MFHRIWNLLSEARVVTIVLLILLGVMLVWILERAIFLHSKKIKPQPFIDGITSLLNSGRYQEALTVCEESPGLSALIVKTALVYQNQPINIIKTELNNVVLLEIPLLERRINSIRLIAKVAPILSFLGMLQIFSQALISFQQQSGYILISDVIHPFYTCLVMVAIGLSINIIGAIGYHFLYGRIRRLLHDAEWITNRLLQYTFTKTKIDHE